jgi:hypothetical protein
LSQLLNLHVNLAKQYKPSVRAPAVGAVGTKNPRYKDRGQDSERPEPGGLTRLASEGSIASDR